MKPIELKDRWIGVMGLRGVEQSRFPWGAIVAAIALVSAIWLCPAWD